jgi:Xaa-Pro aminopeptidase
MASLIDTLHHRRQRLAELVDSSVLLYSGQRPSRNFPANQYPFRASSHFLYFAGLPLENAIIQLHHGRLTLFMDDPHPSAALWHGESLDRTTIATQIGADNAYPLAAILPQETPQAVAVAAMSQLDLPLAQAIVALRLCHDALAIAEIRQAAAVTVLAHQAGMKVTRQAKTEAEVRAAMEQVIMSHNMTTAYNSIVTVHGEVLHNDHYHHEITPQDLLLADVGAETANGWAADVTRTWPTQGKFSATQRALYEVVLAAHDAAIAAMAPGVEYRDIHLLACAQIAAGLVDVGILKGNPQTLVEMDAHALFFPHGVGHLLGLDVHDMEDLGDLAGYAAGRKRSDRFGLGYLRLDRPLQAGMIVTIEPGFYQVPALLNDPDRRSKYKDVVDWEKLAQFSDVRGIRIEDDVLVTDTGTEVLTQDLPTGVAAIEAWMK